MTPQLKQRIEQIRRGEVPEGYKKTQVGIVPAEWAVCNMGEIYSERKETGDPTLSILTVSIHSGVSNGELDESELGKKVKRIEDKTQYLTARKDDLVFNMMRAWQGAIGIVQSDGLVSPAYIVAKPIVNICPAFMDKYIKLPESINRLHKKSYGVTDFRLRLYWDSFIKVDCCLPPLPEQEKISEILTAQERVIELCEKKVEQLKKLKKVFLQKMFPKPGSNVPEWRFPGFAGEWEQRKLGDIMNVTSVKRIHQSDWTDSGIRFLRARDIVAAAKGEKPSDVLYISKEKYEEYSALSGKVSVDDLLVTGVGTIGIPYLISNSEPLYFKDGNIIWFQNSGKINGKFFY